ncbi:MAG: cytochrome c biogenesis protein [Armatimonadetes bacterium]|nr:cytochrome c biogenesis protein [Armatimonadota bacterium]
MFNAIIGIWVTAGLIIGFAMPSAVDLATTPIAFFHVPMAVSMLLMFLAAAFFGVMWLRSRNPKHDALSLAFAEVGFAGCIIALVTGMVFARTNWGAYWSWDPQQVGVLGTLLTYAALFALRGATDDDIKKRDFWAVYALFGVLVACFGSYVYRQILPPGSSLHPNRTLTTSDAAFKFSLWFNVFGYVMLMTKIALIRAQLEVAQTRLKELSWR